MADSLTYPIIPVIHWWHHVCESWGSSVSEKKDRAGPLSDFSAGGVVCHEGKVLLILDGAESSSQAAIREVEEETGWRCRIEGELPCSEYRFQRKGRLVRKTVQWFSMTVIEKVGTPDSEVDEVAWLSPTEALNRLTYDSDRGLLQKVAKLVDLPKPDEQGERLH
jgi:ADP-ribose pyrophosphatase YjhB (NUDIX family)